MKKTTLIYIFLQSLLKLYKYEVKLMNIFITLLYVSTLLYVNVTKHVIMHIHIVHAQCRTKLFKTCRRELWINTRVKKEIKIS